MKIKLKNIVETGSYTESGAIVYGMIKEHIDKGEKITIDLSGVTSLPAVFWNISLIRILEEYGIEKVKDKIKLEYITKLQTKMLTKYILKFKENKEGE